MNGRNDYARNKSVRLMPSICYPDIRFYNGFYNGYLKIFYDGQVYVFK